MQLEEIASGVLLLSLTVYLLSGGADFGAGFWELFARGQRGRREQRLIAQALAPIWEANHVWLIVAIVLIMGAFPKVVPVLATALHVPLLLMLLGISFRGAAFVFRHYGPRDNAYQRRWSFIFAASSTFTPFFLGCALGAALSGAIRVSPGGVVTTDFVSEWLAPLPIAVGVFTLLTGIFLSAVYLGVEAKEADIREVFRRRSLVTGVLVGMSAWGVLLLSASEAPLLHRGLTQHPWSWQFHALTGLLALSCLLALGLKRLKLARALAVAQTTAVMFGLGMSSFPFLVPPNLDIYNSAAPAESLRVILLTGAFGLSLLAPSFGYLYWVFKFRPSGRRLN